MEWEDKFIVKIDLQSYKNQQQIFYQEFSTRDFLRLMELLEAIVRSVEGK